MSKSLGNVIDPMELADKYGADAFRLSILRQMRLESQEMRFHESRCEEARNFNNKIWNATRYMLALPEGLPRATTLPAPGALTLADRWILTRLRETIVRMSELLTPTTSATRPKPSGVSFGTSSATGIWKRRRRERNRPTRAAVLSFVWNNAMRLLHPIAPFVSEEIWLALPHDGPTIVTATWPDPLEIPAFDEAAAEFAARNARDRAGAQPARGNRLTSERTHCDRGARERSRRDGRAARALCRRQRRALARAGASLEEALAAVSVRAPHGVLEERYRKEVAHLRSEIERGEKKLANEAFVAKAAPDVVAKEREKLEGYRTELERVEAALRALKEPA